MKKRVKEKPKRLILDVTPEQHQTIKYRSLKRQLTIREWVLIAINERISREMIDEI